MLTPSQAQQLASKMLEDASDESRSLPDAPPPEAIGAYRIRRIIAAGGMGTVYEAEQTNPHRTVALKILKHGITSRSAMRRFEFEAEILARLSHPNIAHIYEAGTHDDGSGAVPFFAMEYIPGAKTITEYAADNQLALRQRLELFTQVCNAVHHGHQNAIIHRDLKPANILVGEEPYKAANGIRGSTSIRGSAPTPGDTQLPQPKVIDFGIARATDSDIAVTTMHTDIGRLIGTLQYMSPEQCEGDPRNLDIRSDVYSLGVVL